MVYVVIELIIILFGVKNDLFCNIVFFRCFFIDNFISFFLIFNVIIEFGFEVIELVINVFLDIVLEIFCLFLLWVFNIKLGVINFVFFLIWRCSFFFRVLI